MPKTRNDLIVATLNLLNAIGVGQNPAPEDIAAIEAVIDGKLDELEYREIVTLPDRQDFEDVYVDPLSIILANTAAPSFGIPRNPDSQMAAERTLRQIKPSTYVQFSNQDVEWF